MDQKLKEFDLLFLDYKEGRISDEDLLKLQEMLKADEALRQHYIREQALDAMLSIEEQMSLPEEINLENKEALKGNFSLVYALAALLAISLSLAAFYGLQTNSNPVIAHIEEAGGEVQIIRNGKQLKVDELEGILAGDKIITLKSGASLSYVNESTTILLKENSEAVFETKDGAKEIYLNTGDIICDVDKQPLGKPMKIFTPHAEATVLGTQFLLSAGKENSRLHVNEGAVNFKRKGTNESFETRAGWSSRISKKAGIKSFKHTLDKSLIAIKNFTLINADTNQPFPQFDPIPQNAVVKLSELGTSNLNMLANVDLNPRYVGGVRFVMDARTPEGKKIKIYDPRGRQRNNCVEGIFPFMYGGDTDDEPVKARSWKAVPGTYNLRAIPFGEKEEMGALGKPTSLNFKIIQ
ncbi:MAG: FecR family protein [Lentisphaeraceae bacterium]|nr:FecR family protein [Lentisphaeraceae bacterium]